MTQHSSLAPSMKGSTDLNLVSVHELFEHTQDVFNLIARRALRISRAVDTCTETTAKIGFSRNLSYSLL